VSGGSETTFLLLRRDVVAGAAGTAAMTAAQMAYYKVTGTEGSRGAPVHSHEFIR
jgi:hypothetical protein